MDMREEAINIIRNLPNEKINQALDSLDIVKFQDISDINTKNSDIAEDLELFKKFSGSISREIDYKKELEEFMESGSGSGSSSSDTVSDSVKNFKAKLGNVITTIKKRLLQLIRDLKIKYNEAKLKSLKEKAKKTEEKLKACKPIQNKKFELFDFSTWQKDIESCKSKIKNSKTN